MTEQTEAADAAAVAVRTTVAQLDQAVLACQEEGLTYVSVGGEYRLAKQNEVGLIYISPAMKLRELVIYASGRSSAPRPKSKAAAPTTAVPPSSPVDQDEEAPA